MTDADYLSAPFPAATELPAALFEGPKRFFNRELSWLAFNWRVVEEARNPRVPLLERVRFLSISATNLDEFYTVRVAGLRELARAGNTTPAADGSRPAEQLVRINEDARRLLQTQQAIWNKLKKEMESQGITLLTRAKRTRRAHRFLEDYFLRQVFPVLSPLAIDPAHPFPFIPNTGYSLALELERQSDGRVLKALLPIPHQTDRFVSLPSPEGTRRFLPLDPLLLGGNAFFTLQIFGSL